MLTLKNWSVTSEDLYLPPELQKRRLQGTVYGHPRIPDGHFVTTSPIVQVSECNGCKVVTTRSGSQYHLYPADVDPEAERIYPDYYNRLCLK